MTRYVIDPDESQVWVEARSSLHPIHASTTGLTGWLDLVLADGGGIDVGARPQGRLELPVERLRAGNPLEDRELRRRVEVGRFPTIEGRLESLGVADGEDRYRVRGDLTFHGVTRTFGDEMSIRAGNDGTVLLEGEKVFDVRDFDVTPPRLLVLKVHPEVSVRVSLVARRASGGDE